MLRTGCRKSFLAAFALCFVFASPAATAETSRSDSLFEPVVAQQEARIARLTSPRRAMPPEHVHTLLDAGRVDDAAETLRRTTGDARAVARAKLRVALTRQDFASARPLVQAIAARRDPTDAERDLHFAWLFATDDAATVDKLTRASLGSKGDDAPFPDLIAAGDLSYDLLNYDRADSMYARVLARTASAHDSEGPRAARAAALAASRRCCRSGATTTARSRAA